MRIPVLWRRHSVTAIMRTRQTVWLGNSHPLFWYHLDTLPILLFDWFTSQNFFKAFASNYTHNLTVDMLQRNCKCLFYFVLWMFLEHIKGMTFCFFETFLCHVMFVHNCDSQNFTIPCLAHKCHIKFCWFWLFILIQNVF